MFRRLLSGDKRAKERQQVSLRVRDEYTGCQIEASILVLANPSAVGPTRNPPKHLRPGMIAALGTPICPAGQVQSRWLKDSVSRHFLVELARSSR